MVRMQLVYNSLLLWKRLMVIDSGYNGWKAALICWFAVLQVSLSGCKHLGFSINLRVHVLIDYVLLLTLFV